MLFFIKQRYRQIGFSVFIPKQFCFVLKTILIFTYFATSSYWVFLLTSRCHLHLILPVLYFVFKLYGWTTHYLYTVTLVPKPNKIRYINILRVEIKLYYGLRMNTKHKFGKKTSKHYESTKPAVI